MQMPTLLRSMLFGRISNINDWQLSNVKYLSILTIDGMNKASKDSQSEKAIIPLYSSFSESRIYWRTGQSEKAPYSILCTLSPIITETGGKHRESHALNDCNAFVDKSHEWRCREHSLHRYLDRCTASLLYKQNIRPDWLMAIKLSKHQFFMWYYLLATLEKGVETVKEYTRYWINQQFKEFLRLVLINRTDLRI